MNKTYQLKSNAIQGEQKVLDVKPAVGKAPVKLTAAAGARYELIDASTKAAPDNIRVMRKGSNLQIFFDGQTEPGAVIEDFYQAHTDEQATLVGTTEQGKLYEYIPESAAPSAVVAHLGDTGYAYGMALGGQELVAGSGAAVGLLAPVVGAFSPMLLGAGALGAAALAGGGGGGGGGDSPSNPVIPDPNPVANTGQKTAISLNPVTGDNIISATENTGNIALTGKVSGYFAADDVVSVYVNGKTYTGKTATDGSFSINVPTTDLAADKDTKIEAKVTGTGGDTANAAQDYVLETAANPGKQTALSIDPITEDNLINASEAGTTVNITGKVTGTFATTDIVTVTINGKTFTGTPASDGRFSIPVLAADLNADTDTTVEGTVGTSTNAIQNYAVDNTAPTNAGMGLTIAITTDTSNDGIVSSSELGNAAKLTSHVTVNSSAQIGDKVVITASNGGVVQAPIEHVLTASDITNGFDVSFEKPAEGTKQVVTANYVDAFGNAAATDTAVSDFATLDTFGPQKNTNTDPTSPSAGQANLVLNAVTSDNILNAAEAGGSVFITGAAYGEFKSGDAVTLTINKQTYTTLVDAKGQFSAAIKGSDLSADTDTTIDASLAAHDAVGNLGAIAASKTYSVDTTAPQQNTNTTDPTKPNAGQASLVLAPVTADNVLNAAEAGGDVTVTGTAYGEFKSGDAVTLTINKQTYTTQVDANGQFSVAVAGSDLSADANTTIDASLAAHDAVGNLGAIAASKTYSVDTTAPQQNTNTIDPTKPNAGQASLVLTPVTADNVLNAAEAGGNVTVSGTAYGEFQTGDVVKLIINEQTYTTQVDVKGQFSVAVKGSDLRADADTRIDATLAAHDAAGNTGTAASTKNYVTDLLAASFGTNDFSVNGSNIYTKLDFGIPSEAGTYKLYIGANLVIEGNYQQDANNKWIQTDTFKSGTATFDAPNGYKDIQLFFYDMAGNESVSTPPSSFGSGSFKKDTTQFIV